MTGKAVFVETEQAIGNNGAVARAGEKGAAVVFEVSLQPGNMRIQSYPARGVKTGFSLGNDDGNTARTIIEKAGGKGVKIRGEPGSRDGREHEDGACLGHLAGRDG